MSKEPKKVRGLSLLQKRIMAVAAKGWITPAEAASCAYTENHEEKEHWEASTAAAGSRALRRLVQRGLLVYCRPKWVAQSPAYRLPDWNGELPRNNSPHTRRSMYHSMSLTDPSDAAEALLEATKQFDASLADRYKRLDTSLTKAEKEYAKGLPDARQRAEHAKFLEEHPTLGERLSTALTEARQQHTVRDLVEDGRNVLVGILERQRLSGQKSLVASKGHEQEKA